MLHLPKVFLVTVILVAFIVFIMLLVSSQYAEPVPQRLHMFNTTHLSLCPNIPKGLIGRITIDKERTSYKILSGRYFPNSQGGFFKPQGCKARNRTAIIVPYRDREQHLMAFLNNIIPFLTKQQTEFAVFVIEPVKNVTFNRALLMNIGFLEALKTHDFDCFVFHDVDLLPTNDKNLYRCGDNPRHMSVANTKFNKILPYMQYVGGVIGMSRSVYESINGHSNLYFGWGGEDDDVFNRLKTKKDKYKLVRYPGDIGSYYALDHGKDRGNPQNQKRYLLLRKSSQRMYEDGLNSLKYQIKKYTRRELYMWILVDLDMQYYNSQITSALGS